jgi:hypothetical protein
MATPISFRAHFPEFADTTRYSDATVGFWIGIGEKMLVPSTARWGELLDHGMDLFVAHHVVMAAQAMAQASVGAAAPGATRAPVPGTQIGVVTAKSIDRVSVSYDVSSSIEPNAGHWNMTIYGIQFIQLAKMVGSGGMQI